MCLIKMTVAKKIGAKQLKKIAPYKNDWGQKNLNQTVYEKKKIRIKMTVAKKIGTNQLQKMATYKNDCAQKNLNQTA